MARKTKAPRGGNRDRAHKDSTHPHYTLRLVADNERALRAAIETPAECAVCGAYVGMLALVRKSGDGGPLSMTDTPAGLEYRCGRHLAAVGCAGLGDARRVVQAADQAGGWRRQEHWALTLPYPFVVQVQRAAQLEQRVATRFGFAAFPLADGRLAAKAGTAAELLL